MSKESVNASKKMLPLVSHSRAVDMATLIRRNVQAIVGDLLAQHAEDAQELDELRQEVEAWRNKPWAEQLRAQARENAELRQRLAEKE